MIAAMKSQLQGILEWCTAGNWQRLAPRPRQASSRPWQHQLPVDAALVDLPDVPSQIACRYSVLLMTGVLRGCSDYHVDKRREP
jgi:hypothetical protein